MSSNNDIILGLDCGTLNSRACAFIREDRIEIINTRSGKSTIPSFISFSNEILVGEKAKRSNSSTLISRHMEILGRRCSEEIVQTLLNSENSNITDVGGLPKYNVTYRGETLLLYPEMIAGIVLDEVRSKGEIHVGKSISDVVITVPLHFNQAQRQATIDAAKIAGLDVLCIVTEPTAAAIAYFYDNMDQNAGKKTIIVYHLGAATFDLSIVDLERKTVTVRYTNGGHNLGGIYINSIIYDWVIQKMQESNRFDVNKINYKIQQSINKNIEEAKIELNASNEANITIFNCDFDEKISRNCFNELIYEKVISETFKIIDASLAECKLAKIDIDDVLLLGGSCKIEAIKNRMEEEFNRVHPTTFMEHIASRGAAILGAKLHRRLSRQFNIIESVHTRLIFKDSEEPGNEIHGEVVKIPFSVNEEPEEKIIEVLVDKDIHPKIYMRYYIDRNGILKLGPMEDQMEMNDKTIEALQSEKKRISEQNVSTQAIKEALNDLRSTVNKHLYILNDSTIMDKYKEIFNNLCKDIFENRIDSSRYNNHMKILSKKDSIDRYIKFIFEYGRKSVSMK